MKIEKDMFKGGIKNELNPSYIIKIKELKIESGCFYWEFDTLDDLLKAIEELTKEIKGK